MDEKANKPCEGCVELAAEVAELKKQLALIQDQLAKATKNSATSSKPPSSDITNPPAKRKKPGRPRKRKIGGQPGHPRHERNSFLAISSTSSWNIATTVDPAVEARLPM